MIREHNCVQFDSLSKSYFDGDKEIKIVEDISVTFQNGIYEVRLGNYLKYYNDETLVSYVYL